MNDPRHQLVVETGGERLDRYLSRALPDQSRTSLQRLIEQGFVRRNGQIAFRCADRLEVGDRLEVHIPPPLPVQVAPEALPLQVIFEDDRVLIVNKEAGMVVHPAAGHQRGTLVGAVLAHAPQLAEVGEAGRAGIVHRLDKDTSGLILVAKDPAAQRELQRAFAEHRVEKTYLALVDGSPPTPEGRIEAWIGRDPSLRQRMAAVPPSRGREAVTVYRLRERFKAHALLELHPHTGRTHQIRVHLAYLGCPVVGDRVYGRREPTLPVVRQMLHAAELRLVLPGQDEARTFEAALPEDFAQVLAGLRAGQGAKAPSGRKGAAPSGGLESAAGEQARVP